MFLSAKNECTIGYNGSLEQKYKKKNFISFL